MDQVTLVKNKYRLEQWTKLILDCQNSGMKVRDWCRLNNVTHHAYYYWLKKVRLAACDKLDLVDTNSSLPVEFQKLEITSPIPETRAAVIIRLNNTTVEISEGASQQTIQAVLLALQSIC